MSEYIGLKTLITDLYSFWELLNTVFVSVETHDTLLKTTGLKNNRRYNNSLHNVSRATQLVVRVVI